MREIFPFYVATKKGNGYLCGDFILFSPSSIETGYFKSDT